MYVLTPRNPPPSEVEAEDCTPEIDTSEVIVDLSGVSQRTFSGALNADKWGQH